MSLIFTESFDAGPTSSIGLVNSGKWHVSSATTNVLALGRNGNGMYPNATANNVYRLFSAAEADDLIVVGVARKFVSSGVSYPCALYGDCTTASIVTPHVYFQYNHGAANTSTIAAYRGAAGSGTLLGTSTAVVPNGASTWSYLEFKVRLHATTGTVEVKLNGTTILNLTNQNTKNAGTAAVFNAVGLHMWNNSSEMMDDVYVCNEQGTINNDFLGDVRIECMTPNGDGNYGQWTVRNANRMSVNVAGIETDATGWVGDTNCTVARVTTPVHAGLGSTGALQVTASSAADMVVRSIGGTAGVPVLPSTSYYAISHTAGAVSQRAVWHAMEWYDAAGATISRTSYVVASPSEITPPNYNQHQTAGQGWTSPANAAFAAVCIKWVGTANAEVHYLDDVSFTEGGQGVLWGFGGDPGGVTTHHTAVGDMARSVDSSYGLRGDEAYVVSQTDDQIDTWSFTNPSPAIPTGQAVKGVVAYAMARADTPSAKSLALVARLSATDSTSGDAALSQTYGGVSVAWETKPGGGAWTVTDLANAEFGVKLRP